MGATGRDEHACARPVEWNWFDGHVQHMGTLPIQTSTLLEIKSGHMIRVDVTLKNTNKKKPFLIQDLTLIV